MKTALANALVPLIPLVVAALGGLLCALITYGIGYLKSKTSSSKVLSALDRLDGVVEDSVKSVQQSIVGAIKPGDDLAKAYADAKKAAMDNVHSHYGPLGIQELKKVLGWDDSLLDKNLSTKIEAGVHDLKTAQTAAASGGSSATAEAKAS